MQTKFLTLALLLLVSFSTYSQDREESPYKTDWLVDGAVLAGTLGLNAAGFMMIQDKEPLTIEEVESLDEDHVPAVDRWVAGYYDTGADDLSYYPFYGSFAVPFLMMLTDDMDSHFGQLSVLYIESMAVTGALYTLSAGTIDRIRPLSYNEDVPMELRREAGATRSFFGGHTAATASATFFAAKVYNDFYPDSPARHDIWAAAAIIPAWVGYLRTIAGKHFLTDNILGYAVGAAAGILIPELHKKEDQQLSVIPTLGAEYKGIGLFYEFN